MAITTLERPILGKQGRGQQVRSGRALAPVWVEPVRPPSPPAGERDFLGSVLELRPVPRVAPDRSSLRLTRRGRLTLTLLALACALAVTGLAYVSADASSAPPAPSAAVVVQAGDTLWEVAGRADPHTDRRITVARLIELNDLPGGRIRPGQRLILPSR